MRKILIATSNIGKFKEIIAELDDLQLNFVSLKDVKLDKFEAEEPYGTTWQNALEKAKFFAKKSGLITIAEDTGLFVEYLNGAPDVKAKRYGATPTERNEKLLEKLRGVPDKKRGACFETAGCVYNPHTDSFSTFIGRSNGVIAKKFNRKLKTGFGYDAVFYYPPLKKLYVDMPLLEKNMVSQRGKMALQLKVFLMNQYTLRQVICAAGIIVKNRKMLMTKRRDLRPAFNNKWEFPGGGVENGESFDETLLREVKEETGYKIQKIEQLPDIFTAVADK